MHTCRSAAPVAALATRRSASRRCRWRHGTCSNAAIIGMLQTAYTVLPRRRHNSPNVIRLYDMPPAGRDVLIGHWSETSLAVPLGPPPLVLPLPPRRRRYSPPLPAAAAGRRRRRRNARRRRRCNTGRCRRCNARRYPDLAPLSDAASCPSAGGRQQ